jgi:hypothetical protein
VNLWGSWGTGSPWGAGSTFGISDDATAGTGTRWYERLDWAGIGAGLASVFQALGIGGAADSGAGGFGFDLSPRRGPSPVLILGLFAVVALAVWRWRRG